MPYSLNPHTYPDIVRRLLDTALETRGQTIIPAGDSTAAHRLRSMVYGYIKALDTEDKLQGVPYDTWRGKKYRQLMFKVSGSEFIIHPRKDLPEMKAIEAFLDKLPKPKKEEVSQPPYPTQTYTTEPYENIGPGILPEAEPTLPLDDAMTDAIHQFFSKTTA